MEKAIKCDECERYVSGRKELFTLAIKQSNAGNAIADYFVCGNEINMAFCSISCLKNWMAKEELSWK